MTERIVSVLVSVVLILSTSVLNAQSRATITIKKNQNGIEIEEIQSFDIPEGKSIHEILSDMGLLDELGNLKDSQGFSITIDTFPTGNNNSLEIDTSSDYNSLFNSLSSTTYENRPYLGVKFKDKCKSGSTQNEGVVVSYVAPETAADKAGVQINDVIIQLDGKAVGSCADLIQEIQSKKSGDKVKITVKRDGKKKILKATLGEKMMEVNRKPLNTLTNHENGGPMYNFQFGPDSITIMNTPNGHMRIEQPFIWDNNNLSNTETPYLGVTPFDNGYSETKNGVRIKVEPETSAEKMGLISGDIILRFNKKGINSFSDLVFVVQSSKAGDELTLDILRNGNQITLKGNMGNRNCSNHGDFRIFHDFKGMDEGGNYFYNYEFDMDRDDLQNHFEELLKSLPLNSETEVSPIIIRFDDLNTSDKEIVNKHSRFGSNAKELNFNHLSLNTDSYGTLYIKFSTSDTSPIEVAVLDELGEQIYVEMRELEDSIFNGIIDFSHQLNGVYFLQITQGDKSFYKKVTKNP